MDVAAKVITAIGSVIAVVGMGWLLSGAFDYFQGRKNNNPQQMDNGMQSMISGGALSVMAGGIAAAIVAALNSISF